MKKGPLLFSHSQLQLVDSPKKIPFAKLFSNLKFDLKHPNKSNYIISNKYVFNRTQNDREHRTEPRVKYFASVFLLGGPDYTLLTQTYTDCGIKETTEI